MVKVWIVESKKPFDPFIVEGVFMNEDRAWDRKRKLQDEDEDLRATVHGPYTIE